MVEYYTRRIKREKVEGRGLVGIYTYKQSASLRKSPTAENSATKQMSPYIHFTFSTSILPALAQPALSVPTRWPSEPGDEMVDAKTTTSTAKDLCWRACREGPEPVRRFPTSIARRNSHDSKNAKCLPLLSDALRLRSTDPCKPTPPRCLCSSHSSNASDAGSTHRHARRESTTRLARTIHMDATRRNVSVPTPVACLVTCAKAPRTKDDSTGRVPNSLERSLRNRRAPPPAWTASSAVVPRFRRPA